MPSSLKGTLETLLVVDDDEAVLKMVVAILERANFRVLSAHSGPDAIMLAAERTERSICFFRMSKWYRSQARTWASC